MLPKTLEEIPVGSLPKEAPNTGVVSNIGDSFMNDSLLQAMQYFSQLLLQFADISSTMNFEVSLAICQ